MKRPPLSSSATLVHSWFPASQTKTPPLVLGLGSPDEDPPVHSWFEPRGVDPPFQCIITANSLANHAFSHFFFASRRAFGSRPRKHITTRLALPRGPRVGHNYRVFRLLSTVTAVGDLLLDPLLDLLFLVCSRANQDPPVHSWYVASPTWTPLLVLHVAKSAYLGTKGGSLQSDPSIRVC